MNEIRIYLQPFFTQADVAELVDVPDLGSGAFGCMGSSPFIRTDVKSINNNLSWI